MLTGLLNRRGGQEKAETMLAMCRRCEQPMAVLMADIDHLKEYNDAHGPLAGAGALCRVGGALQSVLARFLRAGVRPFLHRWDTSGAQKAQPPAVYVVHHRNMSGPVHTPVSYTHLDVYKRQSWG